MTHDAIQNCRFAFKCTKTWDALQTVANCPAVRYCSECETAVHLCKSEAEFLEHARKGHCVSLQIERTNEPCDLEDTIGVPEELT